MKINKNKLSKIIKEELTKLLREVNPRGKGYGLYAPRGEKPSEFLSSGDHLDKIIDKYKIDYNDPTKTLGPGGPPLGGVQMQRKPSPAGGVYGSLFSQLGGEWTTEHFKPFRETIKKATNEAAQELGTSPTQLLPDLKATNITDELMVGTQWHNGTPKSIFDIIEDAVDRNRKLANPAWLNDLVSPQQYGVYPGFVNDWGGNWGGSEEDFIETFQADYGEDENEMNAQGSPKTAKAYKLVVWTKKLADQLDSLFPGA